MTRRRVVLGLAGAASVIALLTLLTRVVGFGRWFVFSATVGSTCVGTAYSYANSLPNVLFEVVAGGALAAAVVPLLAGPLANGDRASVDRTASALLTWAVLGLAPVALLLAMLAGPIARWLAGDDCPGQVQLVSRMLLVFAPQVVLYGIGVVLTGVLQAHRRFVGPALAPLLSSLVVVGSYLAYGVAADGRQATGWVPGTGTQLLLSLGTTAGVVVLSLPLLVPVLRAGVRLRPTLHLPPGMAVRARRLALAGLAGLLAQQALVLVVIWLTREDGGTGTINVYQYVQAVYLLPYAVLAVPLATAAFPQLSERAAVGDAAGYAGTLARSTRLVVLVAAGGAAALISAAPAVGGVFAAVDAGRGQGSGGEAMAGFAAALTAFAPGLLGFALIAHLGRALFAVGRARWAGAATAVGWLTAAALSVLLVVVLRDGGPGDGGDPRRTLLALGLASTAGMTVAGVGLIAGVTRARVGGHPTTGATAGVARTLAAAVGTGLAAAVVGRLVTDALGPGGSPAEGSSALAAWLLAGVLGGGCAGLVLAAGWALTARGELRTLLGRRAGARAVQGHERDHDERDRDEPDHDEPDHDERDHDDRAGVER